MFSVFLFPLSNKFQVNWNRLHSRSKSQCFLLCVFFCCCCFIDLFVWSSSVTPFSQIEWTWGVCQLCAHPCDLVLFCFVVVIGCCLVLLCLAASFSKRMTANCLSGVHTRLHLISRTFHLSLLYCKCISVKFLSITWSGFDFKIKHISCNWFIWPKRWLLHKKIGATTVLSCLKCKRNESVNNYVFDCWSFVCPLQQKCIWTPT